MYDTVSNLSWSVDLRTHPIANMIEKILADPWPPAEELGREVPEAVPQDDDCIVSFSSNDRCSPSLCLVPFSLLSTILSLTEPPIFDR